MTQAKSSPKMEDVDVRKFLKRGYDAFNSGSLEQAIQCAKLVLKYRPDVAEAHFLVGLLSLEQKKYNMASKAFQTVTNLNPQSSAGYAQLARVFVIMGQYNNAQLALDTFESLPVSEANVMDIAGTAYSLTGRQDKAVTWYTKAIDTEARPLFKLNRAKALMFTGDFGQARRDLDEIIQTNPEAGMPHWMLSRLSKAQDKGHIEQMLPLAQSLDNCSVDAPFLWYGLGKEYEDLEEWDSAIQAYKRGAIAQRSQIAYDEEVERELFKALHKTFTAEWFSSKRGEGVTTKAPIFIIGQPRTGTTLVERILSAHNDVHSAGELQQFRLALRQITNVNSPHVMDATVIDAAKDMDVTELGQLYLDTSQSMRGDKLHFVDKLPVNYMYAPLIAAALPGAKFIHLVRGAEDSCVSSFKQLFADAYAHSYDLEEMARHHLRYRRLMDQWRHVLGGRMFEISYESLVQDVEKHAQDLIKFVGLEWEEACLDFHTQKAAVTTASAAQVREKAHTNSVERWRRFEQHLEPMLTILSQSDVHKG
ncbi:sulfotransferase [Temperatibacter marinus]|uniref:Sulfotransferase n=1 Tax=Temperatibacter marinus TaxID=1456591 RepID=A0AA52H8Q8_9PROT|nr:sulfotransferase [Temperatibacter marinus]WND02094.1 sulfotransferase [Temperatibacter marinus]